MHTANVIMQKFMNWTSKVHVEMPKDLNLELSSFIATVLIAFQSVDWLYIIKSFFFCIFLLNPYVRKVCQVYKNYPTKKTSVFL